MKMSNIKKKLLSAWFYTKLVGGTFITGLLIGQFMQPIPVVKASEDIMTDRQKHFWGNFFSEHDPEPDLDIGYTEADREQMDALIKASLK